MTPFVNPCPDQALETQPTRNGANYRSGNYREQGKSVAQNYVLNNDVFIKFKFFELIHQRYMSNYTKTNGPLAGEEQKKYDDALIKKINALTSNQTYFTN